MDDNDWDLFAVVRGCRGCGEKPAAAAAATATAGVAAVGSFVVDYFSYDSIASGVEMGFDVRRNEFDVSSKPRSQQHSAAAPADAKVPKSTNRSRRRRSQQKKVVCQVPADGVASDMWSWRKYGQKPIKGSPYPRSYYRCSSSKGCLARKQTERSRTDPGVFVVTYTADHNHPAPTYRNSLAGSIRHKPAAAAAEPAVASAEMSPTTTLTASVSSTDEEELELEDEDEAMLLVEDMEVIGEDDFLIMGDAGADSFAAAEAGLFGLADDRLFSQSWLCANNSSSAAAVAGGGGGGN